MKIALVSCAGPDDSNDPDQLARFLGAWPEAEIGVQISRKLEGRPEYPTRAWVRRFAQAAAFLPGGGALHVNGAMCRDACSGTLPADLADLLEEGGRLWRRVQFNFDATEDAITADGVRRLVEALGREHKVVLQSKPSNKDLLDELCRMNVRFDVLHDASGGLGMRPEAWPVAIAGCFNAWAGGLGPETFARDIDLISSACTKGGQNSFGIDAQRRLRSGKDAGQFDLDLAIRFVACAQTWNQMQDKLGQDNARTPAVFSPHRP